MIKCVDVKVINVPHFEGLSVDDMLVFAEQYQDVMEAFPIVRKEVDKLPRAYIANVIHTLVGQPFAQFINKRANKRNEKVMKERDLIDMDPEIARIYTASTAVSGKYFYLLSPAGIMFYLFSIVVKGTSNNLMKAGASRRRTKAEIKEQRRAEARKKIEIENKLAQTAALERQV